MSHKYVEYLISKL